MSDVAGIVILVGRVLFVVFPLYVSGWSFHIKNPKAAEGYAQSVGFPVPAVAGTVSGVWLIVASLSIAVGVFPDVGALMLGAFAAVAAGYFHAFWKLDEGEQKQTQTAFFYRNMIILGACLVMFGFFASLGPALRFSVTEALISLR